MRRWFSGHLAVRPLLPPRRRIIVGQRTSAQRRATVSWKGRVALQRGIRWQRSARFRRQRVSRRDLPHTVRAPVLAGLDPSCWSGSGPTASTSNAPPGASGLARSRLLGRHDPLPRLTLHGHPGADYLGGYLRSAPITGPAAGRERAGVTLTVRFNLAAARPRRLLISGPLTLASRAASFKIPNRERALRSVPQVFLFLADVFAKPVNGLCRSLAPGRGGGHE